MTNKPEFETIDQAVAKTIPAPNNEPSGYKSGSYKEPQSNEIDIEFTREQIEEHLALRNVGPTAHDIWSKKHLVAVGGGGKSVQKFALAGVSGVNRGYADRGFAEDADPEVFKEPNNLSYLNDLPLSGLHSDMHLATSSGDGKFQSRTVLDLKNALDGDLENLSFLGGDYDGFTMVNQNKRAGIGSAAKRKKPKPISKSTLSLINRVIHV